MNSPTNWPNLLPGGPGYREGRIQRQIPTPATSGKRRDHDYDGGRLAAL
jgi:hypothetical protein